MDKHIILFYSLNFRKIIRKVFISDAKELILKNLFTEHLIIFNKIRKFKLKGNSLLHNFRFICL